MSDDSPLRQVEEAYRNAMVAGDIRALERLLADDLTLIDPNANVIGKEALLDSLRSGTMKFTRLAIDELHVKMLGEAAILTGLSTMHVEAAGQTYRLQTRFTHVYAMRAGSWQLTAAQGTLKP